MSIQRWMFARKRAECKILREGLESIEELLFYDHGDEIYSIQSVVYAVRESLRSSELHYASREVRDKFKNGDYTSSD